MARCYLEASKVERSVFDLRYTTSNIQTLGTMVMIALRQGCGQVNIYKTPEGRYVLVLDQPISTEGQVALLAAASDDPSVCGTMF